MSRYIDVDDVIKAIAQTDDYDDGMCFEVKNHIEVEVRLLPTIDIVFCADCRECVEKGVGVDCPSGYGYLYCRRKKSVVNEDDYCSWGVRR